MTTSRKVQSDTGGMSDNPLIMRGRPLSHYTKRLRAKKINTDYFTIATILSFYRNDIPKDALLIPHNALGKLLMLRGVHRVTIDLISTAGVPRLCRHSERGTPTYCRVEGWIRHEWVTISENCLK